MSANIFSQLESIFLHNLPPTTKSSVYLTWFPDSYLFPPSGPLSVAEYKEYMTLYGKICISTLSVRLFVA